MIASQNRSGWFGASDTNIIMGNWNTKTFAKWWLEKLGVLHNNFVNDAMLAGTHYEHRILDHLGIEGRDRQIKKRRFRLRVNLDGESTIIHEVKTYSNKQFKVSLAYWRQAQVQMWATHKDLEIVAYQLFPEDYDNFFNPIINDRVSCYPIAYDPVWIKGDYLPRLKYLAKCLRKRKTPILQEVLRG